MAPKSSSGKSVLQLRVKLEETEPAVWRRLLVPGDVRLSKLHDFLQAAMGWTDSHLHSFRLGDDLYGTQFDDYPDEELDEKKVSIIEAIGDEKLFVYEYDFGDSWEHEVLVEAMATTPLALKYAVCLDGRNACPPEDCGGVHGYVLMLGALANPADEEHEQFLTWLGGPFDPEAFDLAAANAALQRLR